MSRSLVLSFGVVVAFAVIGAGASASSASTGAVTPDQPIALAVSPGGDLFIADRGRNAILEWMPSGRFRLVAGTGVAGLTGDGGRAVRAEVDSPDSLVIAPDRALYFTQAGRYRAPLSSNFGGMRNTVIREITPTGTIRTLAGLHPRCSSGPVYSMPAESALFYGASLLASPNGSLAVDARLCAGNIRDQGFGPNLLLTSAGRFVKDSSSPVPAVASVACGSGVPGPGFHAFSCMSGGGHGRELLVVRSDGSSIAYPDYRGGAFAVGNGEVVATYNQSVVRVTSSRLIPLVTNGHLQRALGLQPGTRPLTDVGGPAIGPTGDIYFVASTIRRRGCQNDIVERTAAGMLRRLWGSSPSRNAVCF